jgi:tRNA threonylcarbamoyl adenosine modification protein YeaZ
MKGAADRPAQRGSASEAGRPILAIDTATSRACLALGDPNGRPLGGRDWAPGHRHAETIVEQLADLLAEQGLRPRDLGAIVVGTGPGAFTGLRVGLATAKTLAYELDRPIVGVATTAALALAAAGLPRRVRVAASGSSAGRAAERATAVTVVLPAGPSDRYVARYRVSAPGRGPSPLLDLVDGPRLLGPSQEHEVPGSEEGSGPGRVSVPAEGAGSGAASAARHDRDGLLVATDIRGSRAEELGIPARATALGGQALAGLGGALLTLGAGRLKAGTVDDAAAIVPTYVSLPRGAVSGGEAWSPDLP